MDPVAPAIIFGTNMGYTLRDFGSYTVGGRTIEISDKPVEQIYFTPTTAYEHNPNGFLRVEQAYVQYFVPERRNDHPPVLLVHGGGMSGAMWETTPDRRKGWLNLLIERGYEVHVIDNVERGRAGWHPNLWKGKPVIRTMQEAWTLFRIGSIDGFTDRIAYQGQRFPVSDFDRFCSSFVPRWTSTLAIQSVVLEEVLCKLGAAHIICHSQGAQVAFKAAAEAAQHISRITALEPSGFPEANAKRVALDVRLVFGDFMENDDTWQALSVRSKSYSEQSCDQIKWIDLARAGLPGHSHMMMMDQGNAEVLSAILD